MSFFRTLKRSFVDSMKSNVPTFYEECRELEDPVMRWEFLKCKIRQFTINYSKEKASERKARRICFGENGEKIRDIVFN